MAETGSASVFRQGKHLSLDPLDLSHRASSQELHIMEPFYEVFNVAHIVVSLRISISKSLKTK
jgi:hypothetical protein